MDNLKQSDLKPPYQAYNAENGTQASFHSYQPALPGPDFKDTPQKFSPKILLIITVTILLLCAIILFGYLYLQKSQKPITTSKNTNPQTTTIEQTKQKEQKKRIFL